LQEFQPKLYSPNAISFLLLETKAADRSDTKNLTEVVYLCYKESIEGVRVWVYCRWKQIYFHHPMTGCLKF